MEYTKWDNLNHKFNIGELRAAAESGDADAQYELGFCYICLLYTSPSPRDA